MYIYLSKKIAIPKGICLKSLAWNPDPGWIACGGENDLLKVLKLDSAATKTKGAKGVAAPSNLSMNQTLDGHKGSVVCVVWNSKFKRLTTSDENGQIIVWKLYKGMWCEEMINNRNESTVADMQWSPDGEKICIVYQDGAVIVGSVDGNRLWGKELGLELALVQWTPDCRNILFVTQENDVLIYDALGNKLATMDLFVSDARGDMTIISIDWYDGGNGYVEPNAPALAIALRNGKVQITRSQLDDNPVLIDTGLKLSQACWNHNGSVLALGGVQRMTMPSGEKRNVNLVQFYASSGQHLTTLKVPGKEISALSWEGSGLRLCLAVGPYIYFANVRPQYRWSYFSNTLAYAYQRSDRKGQTVRFWNVNTEESYSYNNIQKLLAICACADKCVVATSTGEGEGQFALLLFNAIGSVEEAKHVNIEPMQMAMSNTHVVIASLETVYLWQYRAQSKNRKALGDTINALQLKDKMGREQIFHIDDTAFLLSQEIADYRVPEGDVTDAISCICCSEDYLMVGRESGEINRYSLPYIEFESKYHVGRSPRKIALNSNSTRMSIIDASGILRFVKVEPHTEGMEFPSEDDDLDPLASFERKDVWDLIWAEDDPNAFAIMEKTRMYLYRGLEAEDPMLNSGYLCQFRDQKLSALFLDEVMASPTSPQQDLLIHFETKSLRDTREVLLREDMDHAFQLLSEMAHPRLWRLMAEVSLDTLKFDWAEKAFVQCNDYQGIQFVKRLRQISDKMKQKAEVAVYFQRYDDAEEIYREIDRKDMAIQLRQRLGDWFRVLQLVQSGGGDDDLLVKAWNRIGRFYANQQKWEKAAHHFERAKNTDALINAFTKLEQFDDLSAIMEGLPEGDDRLSLLGRTFQIYGIHQEAVKAYVKAGDVKASIDCCVLLNRWGQAVKIAEANNFPQIQPLLAKYANHLLESGDVQGRITAVRLYKRADRSPDAARLLSEMAKEQIGKNPLRAKKLFVLAGLELERYRTRVLDDIPDAPSAAANGVTLAEQTLANLMEHDQATGSNRDLDNCWDGAEAMHFFLLAQRLLYTGDLYNCMRCALKCANYDIIDPVDVYSIIAIASYHSGFFGTCSKAFVKLETLPNISDAERTKYQALALGIFLKNSPVDPETRTPVNGSEDKSGAKPKKELICAASGNLIGRTRSLKCRTCHNYVIQREMSEFNFCPLCHAPESQLVSPVGHAVTE